MASSQSDVSADTYTKEEAPVPAPRKIITGKRMNEISTIEAQINKLAAKLATIVSDCSKPHVDDKAKAKSVVQKAKKVQKGLTAATA